VNINQEREILKKRLRNKEHRNAFVSAFIDETIPFQVRALRDQQDRQWTQEKLAFQARMKQERISTLENPNYGSYSLRTLKQLASAFDVALVVRFIPFSELAEWKLNLSHKSLEVPSFDQEDYFKEKSIKELDTKLLADNYSIGAGAQRNPQGITPQRSKQSGVLVEISSNKQKKQEHHIGEKTSTSIENKMSEDSNEAAVG